MVWSGWDFCHNLFQTLHGESGTEAYRFSTKGKQQNSLEGEPATEVHMFFG